MKNKEGKTLFAVSAKCIGIKNINPTTRTKNVITTNEGNSRKSLLEMKITALKLSEVSWRTNKVVITQPEITKNISTPRKPPLIPPTPK